MFKEIFKFELKYRIGRPATWAYFGILLLYGLLLGSLGESYSSEKTLANSPYSITQTMVTLSVFGMLIASAVMGVPLYRDIEHKVKNYFFSYPITEKSYLLGRYAGSMVILLMISLGLHLGMIIGYATGPLWGVEDADKFGPLNLLHYLNPTLLFYWPNFILFGTLFFALVAFTKRVTVTYVASILAFIAWLLGNALTQDIENRTLVDLLDPFAFRTYENITRYFTPVEQNTLLTALEGNLLWNRLIWIGVAFTVFLITYYRFDFQKFLDKKLGKSKKKGAEESVKPDFSKLIPAGVKNFSTGIYLKQMWNQARLEFRNIFRDPYFLAIMVGALLFLFLDGWFGSRTYGTPALPTTYYMLEAKDGTYIIFVFILIIFYTGEVVHRDRSEKYDGIANTLPVPNWLIYGSKFLAMVMVSFVLVNLVWIVGILNQTVQGFFQYDFGMYFTDLYLIEFPEYVQLVMLAFFVHILVNKKFLGHVASISVWLVMFGIRDFAEYDYNLFFYSYTPAYRISDMNEFGHFMKPLAWFNMYWLALGSFMLVLGNMLWPRGAEDSWKSRIKLFSQRFNVVSAPALLGTFILFLACGSFIYYNTQVLNTYRTSKENKELQASYEKKYRRYLTANQPKIFDVALTSDIYPEERKTYARVDMQVTNKGITPIDTLYLYMGSPIEHTSLDLIEWENVSLEKDFEDPDMRVYKYALKESFRPGDTASLTYGVTAEYQGFTNSGFNSDIVHNGTFFNLGIFPGFGYDPSRELTSDKDRKKYDLPVRDYALPEHHDTHGLSHFLFNDDADYATFRATVSTSADQIAIAPGKLIKEWEEDGRKFYSYQMKGEMDLIFNISSAKYTVAEDAWQNPDGTEGKIQLFHHASHTENLDRFNNSVKHSMEYYNKNFSPYQYNQMRILEFPRYAGFAQSFPNTVPYSESLGWVANFSDPDDIDYAYFVTAHEVAHQWWGHQITPSATRGSNQISESMAEYSALMIMKSRYGENALQKFLRYELDRYLRGRAGEGKFEKTLLDNDTQQYVWYQKGAMILYALQDYITEDTMNVAFRKFLDEAAFREVCPFVTSSEWLTYIEAATPDSLKYFVDESFRNIVLYENKATEATYKKLAEDEYEVSLTIDSKKIFYDGLGEIEKEGEEKSLIEIGILADDEKNEEGMTVKKPLYLKKHWLTPGQHTFTFTVNEKPDKAGIDPYTKLIDRVPEDNLRDVDEAD
ncbi:MAG: M1 family aminopeptidase [Bacteroidota bacterium]